MKSLATRSLVTLSILATLYLVLANLALNLPAAHALWSTIPSNRLALTWRRGWSLYPLRVELGGLAADGQTAGEQWQLDARRAALSVSLPALLRGEIHVRHLDLTDVDLRLRPRPRRDQARDPIVQYLPVIRNRDPRAWAEPARSDEGPRLEVDDIRIQGTSHFWVSQLRGALDGEIRGSFRLDTQTDRFALADGTLDAVLTSLKIGPATPVNGVASLKGDISIPPFAISETKGLEFMRIPNLDAEVDLPVQSLDFLTWLVPALRALDLSGVGRLSGRVHLSRGELLGGTDLTVDARALAMHLADNRFSGDGSVDFRVDPKDEAQADLTLRFDRVLAESAAAGRRGILFTGRGLTIQLHASEKDPATTSTAQVPAELLSDVDLSLVMTASSVQVPDLTAYNRLFPSAWGLALLGGSGTLSGRLELDAETLVLNLDLESAAADVRLGEYRGKSDLMLTLRAGVASPDKGHSSATLDIAGTRLRLTSAQLASGHRHNHQARPWSADLSVEKAALTLPLSRSQAADGVIPGVARTLSDKGFGSLLTSAEGSTSVTLRVSRLDWIADLLGRPMGLDLKGRGELDADIALRAGLPGPGSSLRIPRTALSVGLLDHRIDGNGQGSVTLERGAKGLQAKLGIGLDGARVLRRNEAKAKIRDMRLDTEILVADPLSRDRAALAESTKLRLAVHSARVPDMSAFNPYLPEDGVLSLLGGEARLFGDLTLTPQTAAGDLLLEGERLGVALAGQKLTGDLALDVRIRDGSPQDRRFDISGSKLRMSRVQVLGPSGAPTAADWGAALQMEEAHIHWKRSLRLGLKGDLRVSDTRPFVAMLDGVPDIPHWTRQLLTIGDSRGHAWLTLDGNEAVLEDALIGTPKTGIRAKGRSSSAGQEGMLLVRWKDLSGALQLRDGHRHFVIANATARFDAYRPGRASLPLLSPGRGARSTAVVPKASADAATSRRAPPLDPRRTSPPGASPPRPQTKSINPFLEDDR